MRIGIVAPSCTLDPTIPGRLRVLAEQALGRHAPEFVVHPQCFLRDGHFAGPDEARIDALIATANDPAIDAIWFARGGYGACRVAEAAIAGFNEYARAKRYLGYSDAGFLLAGLYARGIGHVAHGPMPSDLNREGGEAAVLRSLAWLMADSPSAKAAKQVAFNLTVFSNLLGTCLEPDLSGHILLLEEVSEYMYRIDRSLFHVTSHPGVQRVAGIRLGRCSDIPDNDPDFILNEEEVTRHWCSVSGIPYLGRADIGHDAANGVVPFG